MEIKHGFADKATTIRIVGREDKKAEFWIEQHGLPDRGETLAYITADELLELASEIDEAVKVMFGMNGG